MKVPSRYEMNLGVMTTEDLTKLKSLNVAVVGLGGLGGNVVNQLTRLGVGHLILVDFDIFSESNLNRQLFSDTSNTGESKVEVIRKNLQLINNELKITTFQKRVQDIDLLDCDYVIDATDNIETKLYLADYCKEKNIMLLHGSCAGWYGQVGFVSPGSTLLHDLYGTNQEGLEKELFNPPFTPSVVASTMVSEFVKMVQGSDEVVVDELLLIDLYNNIVIKTNGGDDIG